MPIVWDCRKFVTLVVSAFAILVSTSGCNPELVREDAEGVSHREPLEFIVLVGISHGVEQIQVQSENDQPISILGISLLHREGGKFRGQKVWCGGGSLGPHELKELPFRLGFGDAVNIDTWHSGGPIFAVLIHTDQGDFATRKIE